MVADISAPPLASFHSNPHALHPGPDPDFIGRLDWVDSPGRLLLSYCDPGQHAGKYIGRTAVRVGPHLQYRGAFVGKLVSGGNGAVQSRGMVLDGVDPRKQPLVRQLA